MPSSRLRELPESERPREKLAGLGAASLTDAELLAIFIRTGLRGRNAVGVAQDLLRQRGSLLELSRCTIRELMNSAKGIGLAKACELAAAFELGKRLARGLGARPKVDSPEAIYDLMAPEMQALRTESLRLLLLDTKYQLIRVEEISLGSVSESIAHPREIFRPALIHSASAVVLVHNHPSGDPEPSRADHQTTRRLLEAAEILGVRLLDHVVIGSPEGGRKAYASFREMGVIG
ncbi:MAG TPA: DNA repair protein RadC [Chthoniobacterales bacterium]